MSIGAPPPPPGQSGSSYRRRIRELAPGRLLDRDAELEALTRFCLDPDQGPYLWWRADAWTGKTALMGTFFLNPPGELAGRAQMIGFFITARVISQDTRPAFVTAVIGQLAELLGRPVPQVDDEADREAQLFMMLDEAVARCESAGQRLILLVDGLDEDRGALRGPHARSIAGLLPVRPPEGLRVIVAGRRNPPLPDDVPGDHPLRRRGTVRHLARSPHAGDMARLSQQELHRLLTGNRLEQDVLGLLTATRGGLGVADLADLTGAGPVEVEAVLHTDCGRTFLYQGEEPEAFYFLGHEDLQIVAERKFGPRRLDGYRSSIHAWALDHQDRGWPDATPNYLLERYFQLLVTTGDVDRTVRLAGSAARHDLMRSRSGGDAAALAEAREALRALAGLASPDLLLMLEIARHGERLTHRNANIPATVPVVWAVLGRTTRALALSEAIGPESLALTLIALGRLDDAEKVVAAQPDSMSLAVARALAENGRTGPAQKILEPTGDPSFAHVFRARALARAGRFDAAVRTAEALPQLERHVDVLGDIAETAFSAGAFEERDRIVTAVLRATSTVVDEDWWFGLLVASVLARAGLPGPARQSRQRAKRLVDAVEDTGRRVEALIQVAGASADDRAQEYLDEALGLIEALDPAEVQDSWRANLVRVFIRVGRIDRAVAASTLIANPQYRSRAEEQVAGAVACTHGLDAADAYLASVHDPDARRRALLGVALALAKDDQFRRAATVLEKARRMSGGSPEESPAWSDGGARAIARVLAAKHRYEPAGQVALSLHDARSRAALLAEIAQTAVLDGQPEAAARLADRAEQVAARISWPGVPVSGPGPVSGTGLAGRAEAAASTGNLAEAEALAAEISGALRSETLLGVVRAAAAGGHLDGARRTAGNIPDPQVRASAFAALVGPLERAGQAGRARQMIASAAATGVFPAVIEAVAAVGPGRIAHLSSDPGAAPE